MRPQLHVAPSKVCFVAWFCMKQGNWAQSHHGPTNMVCALNCQKTGRPLLFCPLLYFAWGFLSGIDPLALQCSPVGMEIYPASILHFLPWAILCHASHSQWNQMNHGVKQKFCVSKVLRFVFWTFWKWECKCSTGAVKSRNVRKLDSRYSSWAGVPLTLRERFFFFFDWWRGIKQWSTLKHMTDLV